MTDKIDLPVKEIAERYYSDPDLSYRDLAEEYDCSPQTIGRRIREYEEEELKPVKTELRAKTRRNQIGEPKITVTEPWWRRAINRFFEALG